MLPQDSSHGKVRSAGNEPAVFCTDCPRRYISAGRSERIFRTLCSLLSFIADLLGGNKVVLVGNLIQTQLMNAHNWPFAAALSVVLLVLTTVIIWLYRKLSGVKDLEGIV